jgi:Protein of unknown function (DUF1838)
MKKLTILLALFIFPATNAVAQSQLFTPELFKQFTDMRVGTGEPVYWYCLGEIYSYPEGKLIAKVEGVDTARVIKSESNATKVLQLSRKTFFYRDITTNEVLKIFNGQKVEPIEYPYQQITYQLKDGKMFADVVQGKAPRIQTINSEGGNLVRKLGDVLVFSAPLFLNYPNYKAFENYDFFIQPKTAKNTPKYQLTWNRRGDMPKFFGGGDSVFQLVSYRVDKYADLPQTLRDYLEKDAKMWMNPPKDLAEITELQK